METIKGFIVGTPWWVYLLFIYLVYIGFKASKDRIVSIYKMLLLPIIFGWLAIDTIMQDFTVDTWAVLAFIVSLAIFTLLGYLHVIKMKCSIDLEHKLVKSPGTWSVLIIVLIIFVSKYYFGYQLAVDPSIVHNRHFEMTYIAVSAACIGYLLGKVLAYARKMSTQTSMDLSKK
ncbi:MAG: hypothetical protein P1U34_07055 [Coxiellaceae bacterium]|nr:hypothetical protein [Coxiellaceae bacterium]